MDKEYRKKYLQERKEFEAKQKKKSELRERYKDLKFSEERYKDLFFEKLDRFITFFEKYDTTGFRVIKGVDLYQKAKDQYDKIMSGELFVDKELMSPDSTIRNVIMLIHIDEKHFI